MEGATILICRPDNGQAAQKSENVLIFLAEKFHGMEMLYESLSLLSFERQI